MLLISSALLPAAGPDAADVRRATDSVLKSGDIQSRLPDDSGTTDVPLTRRRDRSGLGGGEGIYIPGAEAIFGLAQWAFVVIAVIAILAVLAIVLREPFEARFHPEISPAIPLPGAPTPPADPRELLARADRLAAAGNYAEAMHCVLLAAMILTAGPAADKTADSRTSWELLRSAALAPPQFQALRDLVIRVERAWFGQRPAGADDYRHVRLCFDAFASPAAVAGTA